MLNKELLQQALDALEGKTSSISAGSVIAALQEALAAPPAAPAPVVPDSWRMAVDAAMVGHALDCTTPDRDPKQCVELLCKQVADIWRDIAAPVVPHPDEFVCPYCFDQGAAPAVPLTDERAGFEAWIRKDGGDLTTFGAWPNMHYRNSAVNNAWTGWKARAAHGIGGGGK